MSDNAQSAQSAQSVRGKSKLNFHWISFVWCLFWGGLWSLTAQMMTYLAVRCLNGWLTGQKVWSAVLQFKVKLSHGCCQKICSGLLQVYFNVTGHVQKLLSGLILILHWNKNFFAQQTRQYCLFPVCSHLWLNIFRFCFLGSIVNRGGKLTLDPREHFCNNLWWAWTPLIFLQFDLKAI